MDLTRRFVDSFSLCYGYGKVNYFDGFSSGIRGVQ